MIFDLLLLAIMVIVTTWLKIEIQSLKKGPNSVWQLEREIKEIRKDIFLTAKNPSLARKTLKNKEKYQ